MTHPSRPRGLRRLLPRSLLGRSLLIILLPLVLLQAVVWQIFYRSHLDILSRRLSMAIAGEIGGIVELLERFPGPDDRVWIIKGAWERSDLKITVLPAATLPFTLAALCHWPVSRQPMPLSLRPMLNWTWCAGCAPPPSVPPCNRSISGVPGRICTVSAKIQL